MLYFPPQPPDVHLLCRAFRLVGSAQYLASKSMLPWGTQEFRQTRGKARKHLSMLQPEAEASVST